jgi:hypothetical protein
MQAALMLAACALVKAMPRPAANETVFISVDVLLMAKLLFSLWVTGRGCRAGHPCSKLILEGATLISPVTLDACLRGKRCRLCVVPCGVIISHFRTITKKIRRIIFADMLQKNCQGSHNYTLMRHDAIEIIHLHGSN